MSSGLPLCQIHGIEPELIDGMFRCAICRTKDKQYELRKIVLKAIRDICEKQYRDGTSDADYYMITDAVIEALNDFDCLKQ